MIYKIEDKYFQQIKNSERSFVLKHKLPPTKNEPLIFENIDTPNDKDRFIFVKKNNGEVVGRIKKNKLAIDCRYMFDFTKEYYNLFDDFVKEYIQQKTYIIYIDYISTTHNLRTGISGELEKKCKVFLKNETDKEIKKLGYDCDKE